MLLSDDYLKAFIFIEAIKYLSKNNNGYDIVFRPHPSESVECWKILLEYFKLTWLERALLAAG